MRARPLAVVAVLVALVGAGEAARPAPPAPVRSTSVEVLGATVVCPDVDGAAVTAGSTGSGPGGLLVRPLDGAYAALPVAGAGEVAVVPPGTGALEVAADGAVAGRLAVELRTRDLEGPVRGLTAGRCSAAGTSSWFVGGATVVGQGARLVLANADTTDALVDVTGWSAAGPVERRPGRGIVVPARGRTVVELDTVAPDRDLLALHVQAVRGRVAAALRHTRLDGRTPLGLDLVPASPPPATELLVPGLPAGPGRRTVLVTNPGADETVVDLQLVTGDGLVDLPPLSVPAGTSVAQDVSEQLRTTPAAVRVRSQGGPVLAAASAVDVQDGPVREIAWSTATPVLTGPALLGDVALTPQGEVTLLLSAPDADATVELAALRLAGQRPPPTVRRVEVPGGTTVAVRLSTLVPPGTTVRLALELRASGGPVVAARYLRERGATGPLTALLPALSETGRVRRPAVRQDPLAGRG